MKLYFNRIQMLFMAVFALCMALMIPILALAADAFPIPEGDVAQLLINLATNYKTLGLLGILSIVTLVSVQAVKKFAPENWKYKRLTTLGVAIVYSIISGIAVPGSNALSVIVTVFVTSGGAMALYEALKGAGVIKKA